MNNTIKLSVNSKNSGKRLDIFLTESINNYTRSFLKKMIELGQVKLNGKTFTSPALKLSIKIKFQLILLKQLQKISFQKK